MLHILRHQRAENARIRNLVLPISRLPTEVLCHIFVAAVEEETARRQSSTKVPLYLSHVCHIWRNIAFELSDIWATINCHIVKGNVPTQARNLRNWIARSKERLLSIQVSFQDEQSWNETTSRTIIATLVSHSHRWKKVDLIILKSWLPYLESVQGKVQNLESLSIRTAIRSGNPDPVYDISGFDEAPSLREVVLSCAGADYTLPFIQLSSVTLLQPTIGNVLELLQLSPFMIQGRFLELIDDPDWPTTIAPPHAALEQLTISLTDSAPFPIEDVLDHLMLPQLCRLSLALVSHDSNSLNSVKALIDRSGCPLSTLQIQGPSFSNEEIIDFLQSVTRLVCLDNSEQSFIAASDAINE
jgi:hypothetical protein